MMVFQSFCLVIYFVLVIGTWVAVKNPEQTIYNANNAGVSPLSSTSRVFQR